MSEEKLYAVKNDEGKYWDLKDQDDFWELSYASCPTTDNELDAKDVIDEHGGHIVTLIEEPEKVVLTKEQAKIVEDAHGFEFPASYITSSSDDEELLMNAYVNGWTVKRPQRWYVKTPDNWMGNEKQGWLYKITGVINTLSEDRRECTQDEQFTTEEIKKYHLDGFEKEEVTDDEQ